MTIYTSQRNMLSLFHNLTQPGQCSVVTTNLAIKEQQMLGKSAFRILSTPNAGGSSIYSEALSIEFLSRLLGVDLFKTETELIYDYPEENNNGGTGPIMDYACHYQQLTLGVSVTRAMAYQRPYTKQDAYDLLIKKLAAIVKSSQNIANTKFDRHILHIWTESGKNAALVNKICRKLRVHEQCKDTIILITTVNTQLVFFNHNLSLIKLQRQQQFYQKSVRFFTRNKAWLEF
ncbi:uncharacterized protein B0P05DRAFT_570835 [Gilbertella persicaria]|nr:uncharacterized protein B0P05DRAFT_570835 [Gilbertella persicaria]KAI8082607.1 hypothetical protein B0P05DRAFT_570835 [Gilbertella persicaria]